MDNLEPASNGQSNVADSRDKNNDCLNDLCKKMVANLYKYIVKGEVQYVCGESDIFGRLNKKYVKKCARALGLSEDTVLATLEDKRKNLLIEERMHYKLDKYDLAVIRRKVHQFYNQNEGPTVNKVLKSVHDDETLPNLTKKSLCKVLKRLKFQYMTKNRDCLIEEDFGPWRFKYLEKIQKYRKEGRFMYYLDETWIDAGHTEKRMWQEGYPKDLVDPAEKEKMLVVGHVGSEDGFLDGALHIFEAKKNKMASHDLMNAEKFEEWIKEVLPKLKKDSVLVLDSTAYHSRPSEETPDELWPKIKIQEWLKSKNIDYDPSFLRVELMHIVMKEKMKMNEKFALDELAAAHGVTICRIPLYYSDLNPIQEIFSKVKEHVAKNNKTFKLEDVKKLFNEGITQVTTETWKECIKRVINVEDNMSKFDHIVDDVTDMYGTNEDDSDEISLYSYSDEYSDVSFDEQVMEEEENDDE